MEPNLIALIAVTFALIPLVWRARRDVWLAAMVAALCAPLSGIVPTAGAATLLDPAFTDPVKVSQSSGNSNYPQIASKDDKLFSVWIDGTNITYRRITIFDGKATPDVTVKVTDIQPNGGFANSPQIATDPLGADNNVYIAWTQTNPSTGSDIWLKRSTDAGASFGSAIKINKSGSTTFAPRIAVAGKYVFVAWGDFTDAGFPADDKPGCYSGGGVSFDLSACRFSIYVAASQDGGETFGTPVNVSYRPSANGIPAIAAVRVTGQSAAMAYVTWPGISRQAPWGNIFFASTDDSGATWTYATECGGDKGKLRCTDGFPYHPQVVASANGDVYVAWSETPVNALPGDNDILIAVGRDRGSSFETPFNLSHSPGTSDYPELAISNSGVQVVWHDGSTGVMDVFHSRGINGGKDFSERRSIDFAQLGFTYRPRVAASGDNVHVVWSDGFDVYYALSTNNGLFFDYYFLSTTSDGPQALRPRLAPNGSFVAAVWDQGGVEPLFDPLPRGERDIYVGATVPNRGDLMIEKLEAVQAPFAGKALAQGKPTVLHVQVQNQFLRKVTTKLKLVYDTVEGGVPTTITRTERIDLTPGVNKLYLPPDSFIWPAAAEFRAWATVDPDGEVEEVDESNNTASITVPVKDTGHLRVLYVPVRLPGREPPTCEQVRRVMEISHRYIRAIYPVEPSKLRSDASCFTFEYWEWPPLDANKRHRLLYNLEGRAKFSIYDMVVGVVPPGWFEANTEDLKDAIGLGTERGFASIVEARLPDDAAATTAHEIAHNLGWVRKNYANYDKENPSHLLHLDVGGYWVTERREVKGTEFMYFTRPPSENWIINDSYDYLMGALISLNERPDPKVILLRGAIGVNGTATLDPWYRFESLLDMPLNHPGTYTVSYLDAAGQPLGETAFDLPAGIADGGSDVPDMMGFSRLIPDVPGTKKIAIKKGSQILAERTATPNSPTVKVLSPNGGERLMPGDTLKITWESADADGDALKHAVMLSRDAGLTWLPLVMDYDGREFSVTLDAIDASKDARVKVIVTDGFNGAEDSSDAGFSIGGATGGLTFGPTEMLRDNVNRSPIMATARTVASGDNVYAVWAEETCTGQQGCYHAETFFRRSTDRGLSFEPVIILSTNSAARLTPNIAVSGNNVYVTWNEGGAGGIALRRSIDGGATFEPTVMLTTNGAFAEVAAVGDSVYVVWETYLTAPPPLPPWFMYRDVFYRASNDRGASFGPAVNLSVTGNTDSMRPQVVAAGSNVYVAWHEANLRDSQGIANHDIRVRRSLDGGTTFDPAVIFTGNAIPLTYGPGTNFVGIADTVRMVATGNELYLAWRDEKDFKAKIAFTRSVDAGTTFAPVVALSNPSRSPWFAQLAVSAGQVYVAWSEGDDVNDRGSGTMMDVLFRASADGGVSFAPETVLSTSHGRALFPHLVAQGDTVDLIWTHNVLSTQAPWEVVFRQSTNRGQSFGAPVILGTELAIHQLGYPQLAVTPGNVYATWLGVYDPFTSSDYRYVAFKAGTVGQGSGENRPPTANAGLDRTVTEGSVVALVGLGSDLDGDKLTFSWQQTGGPAVTLAGADTATPAFTAPVGSAGSTLTFQLKVGDGKLQSEPSEIKISVTQRPPITNPPWLAARTTWEDRMELPTPVVIGQPPQQGDTTPPTTTATLAGTLGSNGWYKAGEPVRLTLTASDVGSGVASTSYAINGGAMQNYSAPVVFTDGTYTVTYRSVDKAGNVESLKSTSFKVDQAAPKFSTCAANPPQLWPPNHNMVDVTVSLVVTDDGSGPSGFVLKSTTSNEPDNGIGDGDMANDIQGFEVGKPDTQGQLRAERSGRGTGRIYKLAYQTVDAAGNVGTCIATVRVPQDQGPSSTGQAGQAGKASVASASTSQASSQGKTLSNAAPPLVFQAAAPDAASIQGTIAQFRAALGGLDNRDDAGPLPSGRREINWDGRGNDQTTTIAKSPFSGFEVTRGAIFTTPDGTGFVQAPPAADPVLFPPGGLAGLFNNLTYGTIFGTLSPSRLFSAIGSNVTEVDFVVPGGGDTTATTRGFGAVFANVGEPDGGTLIEYFGADGTLLFSSTVPASPGDGGLSFFGIVFDEARIGWVRITGGDAAPGPGDGQRRIVVMDDLIYGEPQPLP